MLKIEIQILEYENSIQKTITLFGVCVFTKIFHYPKSKEWEIPSGMI